MPVYTEVGSKLLPYNRSSEQLKQSLQEAASSEQDLSHRLFIVIRATNITSTASHIPIPGDPEQKYLQRNGG
jgi:hypothetical protein